MSLAVRGADSVIVQTLADKADIIRVPRGERMPGKNRRYLFCAGLIHQQRIRYQDHVDHHEAWAVNAANVIRECERLLDINPVARICVIGSESAYKGSFDMAYAGAKAALHMFVENKRLKYPSQQLVCVAPTCIAGSGMNKQRNADGVAALAHRVANHPKRRWLEPQEVADMVFHLLYVDKGYTTNTVIRMNGGEHARS